MSRQNKVNPGMYTQRGRLTQDDAARELKRQREVGSEHRWQPSKKDQFPRMSSKNGDAALGAETSGDNDTEEATPAPEGKAASQATRAAASKAPAAARKTAKQSSTSQAKPTKAPASGKAKAAKTAKPVARTAKSAGTKTAQKAAPPRGAGGGGPKARTAAKKRKS